MKRIFTVLSVAVFMVACSNKSLVRARVYERKEVTNNLIMIKYSYKANGKTLIDSATVRNQVMEGDSINVAVDFRKPGKSKPSF
jgi:hypothetical protein